MDAQNITTQAKELETSVNEAGLMDSRSIEYFKVLAKHGITTIEMFDKCYVGQFDINELPYHLDSNYIVISTGLGITDWDYWFNNPNLKPIFDKFRRVES